MKKNMKDIGKLICFLCIAISLFQAFDRIYSFKYADGIYGMETFYKQKNDINDVIFVGSSHIFEDVNTAVLWEAYGMATYDLAGAGQPFWNTYYYIKEVVKTQTPKLIVVDLLGATQTDDYKDTQYIIKNTYGLKFGKNKIDAIKVSARKEDWTDYFTEIPTYHSRYSELTREDFLPNKGIPNWEAWKGFVINTKTKENKEPENFQTDKIGELTEKTEKYLRLICEFCNDNKIALLFIKSPTPSMSVLEREKYNRGAEIAAEYGIPFMDFNNFYEKMELDFSTDMADNSHLNYRGNVKYTKYLANYLKSNYEIPDRRGQEGYESYDVIAKDCMMRTKNAEVSDTVDLADFLEKIQDEHYVIFCSANGDYKKASNYKEIKELFGQYDIELEGMDNGEVLILMDGKKEYYSDANTPWHKEMAEYKTISVKSGNGDDVFASVRFNTEEKTQKFSGINIVVYDTVTETIVDSACFRIAANKISEAKVTK